MAEGSEHETSSGAENARMTGAKGAEVATFARVVAAVSPSWPTAAKGCAG
jgi:hypothetical protein